MKILLAPHPMLSQKTSLVKKIDKRILRIAEDMKKTLLAQRDPIGVGLSANQVGIMERLFLLRRDEKRNDVSAYINPEVISTVEGSQKRKPTLEGCLSIPAMWGNVLRPEKIHLHYQDLAGKEHKEWFEGFDAIVVQHELDHLNGILFTQRVLEQHRQLYKEVDGELEPWKIT